MRRCSIFGGDVALGFDESVGEVVAEVDMIALQAG
jgi:hypothetical protein